VRIQGDEANALFYLGSCYEQASRAQQNANYFARAVETFKRLISLQPEDAFALNYLGYMYAEKGIHLQEAVELLLRAIEIDPDNSAFLDSLGWAYFRLGEYDQAEHYLARALQYVDGDDGEEQAVILDHAGDIAAAQGKKNAANKHWQRALELDPNNDAVRGKLKP
jgi:tetratricopeptide (TPR) repeat protein